MIINMPYTLIFLLFLTVLTITIWILVQKKGRATSLLPPPQKTQSILGYNIFYDQIGKGEPLLLLHGIGASTYVWRRLIPYLSNDFKIISVDLLGFGNSDKPTTFRYDLDSQCQMILELLKKLNIPSCYLVGSSMGGAIALRLTQTHPHIFKKTIAISPAADPKISRINLSKLHFISSLVSPIISDRWVEQIMKRVVSDSSLITKESIQAYALPYKNKDAISAFTKSFSLLRDPRIQEGLAYIQNPVLIIWGQKDKIIPPKYAHKIQKSIPKCKLEIHPTAGHHPQEDEPQWTAKKIHDFLTETL